MSQLLAGVRAFQKTEFPTLRSHYGRLKAGQNPKALFITCSDSRVEPGRLTQTLPGELFVIRNAGNIVPNETETDGVLATIEFAVKGLQVPEIIVCGHSHCGAMKALLNEKHAAHLPTMKTWLGRQNLGLNVSCCDDSGSAVWETAVNNVLLQLTRLREIPCVAAAVATKALTLSGWCYQFETGEVYVVDEETGDARPIGQVVSSDAFRAKKSVFRRNYRGGL